MIMMAQDTVIGDEPCCVSALAILRLQSWLSPAFPVGAYSYSHGLEWAVEAGLICDRKSLVEWLEADLRFGSARNDAIFFREAWRCTIEDNRKRLLKVAALAAAFRGTSELSLESSQQGSACLSTLRRAWPDRALDRLSELLRECDLQPALAVVLGIRSATQGIAARIGLAAFLQGYVANLVNAGVRLIPLGQTDAQLAIAELENAVLAASKQAGKATIEDLGSAAFMVDIASSAHETQYTRLFRS